MHKALIIPLSASLFLPFSGVRAEPIGLDQIPEAVMDGMRRDHPEARNVRADREVHFGETHYELKLNEHGQSVHQTLLDSQGRPFGHEEAVAADDLPAAVKRGLAMAFTTSRIKDAERIHDRSGLRVEYEIDVTGDGADWEIVMDPEGNVLTRDRD